MFQNLSAKFDKFWTMGRSPFWISKFGRFENPWNFEMELGPPVSLTCRLTVHTGHWPRARSPSAGHSPMTIHHAPATGSPAAAVSQPYPHAWPGRGRPLPFRSYRDHVASLCARSRHALPSHWHADRHHSSEPPPSKSLMSTGSSSSSYATILKPSHRLHCPEELRETSPMPVASCPCLVPPPHPWAPPWPHGARRPPHRHPLPPFGLPPSSYTGVHRLGQPCRWAPDLPNSSNLGSPIPVLPQSPSPTNLATGDRRNRRRRQSRAMAPLPQLGPRGRGCLAQLGGPCCRTGLEVKLGSAQVHNNIFSFFQSI
jgi:hypothetical protein